MKLKDGGLFREQAYVGGSWVDADGGQSIPVKNPATGDRMGCVPRMGKEETRRAIQAAADAFPLWRAKTAKERGQLLRKWFEGILSAEEDLAVLMTTEQGKPLSEARSEVAYAASFVEWYSEEGKRVYGDVIPQTVPDRRILVFKEPVGVCAAITPWNFPLAMVTRKVAAALAAGCTAVVKPARQTPFSALALACLAERAGFPKGVFNVVTGPSDVIGEELALNPAVRKMSFTGSTEVGKKLMTQCSSTMKKISLELGGCAPFIVFEDADVARAVEGAMASKFRNSGQTCICANRFLVHEKVYEDFAARLTQAVRELKVGNGFEEGVQVGPLIDSAAVTRVSRHMEDAVSKGAQVVTGGKLHRLGGTFYEPTVLREVTPDMLVAQEETFGPLTPLIRFHSDEEAVRIANATPYGLAAYFYSRDIHRVWRVAEALEYGLVGVNTGIMSSEAAPFGGMKESGLGREGSKYGIEEYLEIKYVCLGL